MSMSKTNSLIKLSSNHGKSAGKRMSRAIRALETFYLQKREQYPFVHHRVKYGFFYCNIFLLKIHRITTLFYIVTYTQKI